MVRIRLRMIGRRRNRSYRIVVTNSNKNINGKYIDLIGNINTNKKKYNINLKKYFKWINIGIKPNNRIKYLMKNLNISSWKY